MLAVAPIRAGEIFRNRDEGIGADQEEGEIRGVLAREPCEIVFSFKFRVHAGKSFDDGLFTGNGDVVEATSTSRAVTFERSRPFDEIAFRRGGRSPSIFPR